MSKEMNDNIDMNKGTLTIPEEKKELNLFRAMYYQLNAKPDSMSKVFAKQIVISKEDIIDLNSRVVDKIKMHCQEDDGFIATITVRMSNRKIINFECWEEFVTYQWNETAHIKSVVLKWNFNVRMPQYAYPQNHSLMVKISDGLRPEEMLNLIFSGKIEDFEDVDTNTFPVAARVDFIEALLGEELLNVVSKWVNGLKRNSSDKNPFLMVMKKYRKKVAYYFNYVAFFMLIILATAVINKIFLGFGEIYVKDITVKQLLLLLNSAIGIVVALAIAIKVFEKIAQKVYEKLEAYGTGFIFNITKGDIQKQEDIAKDDTKSGKSIIGNLIFSLIFNVICGIITALII
ncbi:MAG: hypothetical protein KH304_10695 [Clostridium sp.]|nr:hypothetical protein [Clostridium sp.]